MLARRSEVAVDDGYTIGRAEPHHLRWLPEIEYAAGRLLVGRGLPESALEAGSDLAELIEAQQAGLLWVALSVDASPVGFAKVGRLDATAHLEEIDVHPAHGRRGIGTALVETVCRWAHTEGLSAVTLTTFRNVPWNAPFYARLGFRAVAAGDLSPAAAERVRTEAGPGVDPRTRVFMQFDTRASTSDSLPPACGDRAAGT
jgi:GNAT superfamily N-acetyltransferase